ncbi:MAG: hypothetical protein DCF22_08705 [Leptolyngbya sp.]|nr:MAG: hypothetical protein DCF22_08705 [Leptolyngbya sp.]
MDWQELYGNWVLIPDRPIAIIHFLGGAFVATAPQVTYRRLLERLAVEGYAVIATPFINTFDHSAIAQTVYRNFNRAIEALSATQFRSRYLPIYGVGHSMGCKLHLLIGSLYKVERAGNILISFNNYAARDAVPLVEQVTSVLSQFTSVFSDFSSNVALEFTPSPVETNQIISQGYQVPRNLLVKFSNDTIDQTRGLTEILQLRFPEMVTVQKLTGNHLTPLGPDVNWQAGESFAPWDAIAQWMRQEVYRELHQLECAILRWLNPLETR